MHKVNNTQWRPCILCCLFDYSKKNICTRQSDFRAYTKRIRIKMVLVMQTNISQNDSWTRNEVLYFPIGLYGWGIKNASPLIRLPIAKAVKLSRSFTMLMRLIYYNSDLNIINWFKSPFIKTSATETKLIGFRNRLRSVSLNIPLYLHTPSYI